MRIIAFTLAKSLILKRVSACHYHARWMFLISLYCLHDRPHAVLSFFACFHFCALCAITIDENMFAADDPFKVRWFGTELHIIVNEFGDDSVFSVGQNESHLFILLCNDGHEAQVVDIDIGRAQEVV